MEFKLFTDLIDALGKAAGGLKAIVNLPKAEREAMRRTLDEAYRLIDTTLNMVVILLGDILTHAADGGFLYVPLRESETLAGKLVAAVFAKDRDALVQQVPGILATEGEVALPSATSSNGARMRPAVLTWKRRDRGPSATRGLLSESRS